MKAKEKAKKLVERFAYEAHNFNESTECDDNKNCALIYLNELLKFYNCLEYHPEDLGRYWKKVEEEIKKL